MNDYGNFSARPSSVGRAGTGPTDRSNADVGNRPPDPTASRARPSLSGMDGPSIIRPKPIRPSTVQLLESKAAALEIQTAASQRPFSPAPRRSASATDLAALATATSWMPDQPAPARPSKNSSGSPVSANFAGDAPWSEPGLARSPSPSSPAPSSPTPSAADLVHGKLWGHTDLGPAQAPAPHAGHPALQASSKPQAVPPQRFTPPAPSQPAAARPVVSSSLPAPTAFGAFKQTLSSLWNTMRGNNGRRQSRGGNEGYGNKTGAGGQTHGPWNRPL